MSDLTITQDAEGTLLNGSSKGDGVYEIVKPLGWRWGRSIACMYWPRNRRPYTTGQLQDLAAKLQTAGHSVELELVESSFAEREAARNERLEGRQDALQDKAARKAGESDELESRARAKSDLIPFGQPILVGHHSEGRHRRHLANINRLQEKSWDAHREATQASDRAAASAGGQKHRESAGATMRRIDRLEVERRDVQRRLDGVMTPQQKRDMAYGLPAAKPATGEHRERLLERAGVLDDELGYWRAHLESLRAQGARIFTRDDVNAGDEVQTRWGWSKVLRANPKTVTVDGGMYPGHRMKLGYDDLRGVRTPEAREQEGPSR